MAPDYSPASEHVDFVRSANIDGPGEIRTIEITLTPKGSRPTRTGLTFVQNVPQAALDAFERAKKLLGSGHDQEAQAALQDAIKLFPDYFDARFVLASELTKQGKFDEAIKQLNEAQRINPRDDRVWYSFGVALQRQGKYAVAARVFAQAAELNPAEPQNALLAEASALIDQASTMSPSQPQGNSNERTFALNAAEEALARAERLGSVKLPGSICKEPVCSRRGGTLEARPTNLRNTFARHPTPRMPRLSEEAIKRLRESSKENGAKKTTQ